MTSVLKKILTDKLFWLFFLLCPPVIFVLKKVFYWQVFRPTNHLYILLAIIIIYPIFEECIFRGVLQGLLLKKDIFKRNLAKISYANIIISLVFVLSHLFYHPTLWAILVFIPSIIFGIFREKYNHLLPSILLHIWYNTGYFIFIHSI